MNAPPDKTNSRACKTRTGMAFGMRQTGFSLVEIAVVLAIIGLALGAGITILNARLTQGKIDTTKARVEGVRQALVAYVSQNYRLPCPAAPGLIKGVTGYNVEQVAGSPGAQTCIAADGLTNNVGGTAPLGASRGTVPCATLGISDEACYDAYGTRLTYFVENSAVRLKKETVSGISGSMTLHNVDPPAPFALNLANQISQGAAIVISHGANRGGGYAPGSTVPHPATLTEISAYEQENTDADIQFVQNSYVERGTNSFDDVLAVVIPRELIVLLSQANIVKDPRVVTADRFPQIKAALLTKMFESTPLAPQGTVNDRGYRLAVGSGTSTIQTDILSISSTAKCPSVNTQTLELPTVLDVPSLSSESGLREDGWGRPIRYKRHATNGVAKVPDPAVCQVETAPTSVTVFAHICIPATPPVPPPPPPAIPASEPRERLGNCTTPFILISDGPDRLPNTVDDIYYVVSYDELQQYVKSNNGW